MSSLQTDRPAAELLDTLADRAADLYSLPKVAMDVLELTGRATVDAEALGQCIAGDPALTAKILRVVNSAMFGLSAEVTQLTQAVSLLGVKPLKLLVLGFSLPPKLLDAIDEEVLAAYWQHALIKAAAMRELARYAKVPDEEEAFIAGLLQDLGVLLLIQELGTPYTRLFVKIQEEGGDLPWSEREALGFNHIDVTRRLLESWGFPQLLVLAIATPFRGNPVGTGRDAADHLVGQLHVAELLTRQLTSGDLPVEAVAHGAQSAMGMTAEALAAVVDRLQETAPQLAQAFAVPWNDEAYLATVSDAHRQLSRLVESDMLLGAMADGRDRAAAAGHPSPNTHPDLVAAVRNAAQDQTRRSDRADAPAVDSVSAPRKEHAAGHGTVARRASLTDDNVLAGFIRQAARLARQRRTSVGLLLFEIENYAALESQPGPVDASTIEAALQARVSQMVAPELPVHPTGDGRIASVLVDRDRLDVVSDARQILCSFDRQVRSAAPNVSAPLSAGIAIVNVPSRDFCPAQLIEAAERCLYAARCAGGETVKSIEL